MKTEEQITAKKLFAGEKKTCMKRRSDFNDYKGRRMYMITMEVEGRRPLFGSVVGSPFAPVGSPEFPHMELSSLGSAVQAEWQGISHYYPQIEPMVIQMMPDHLHGILFVHETLPVHLGQVLAGFKKGCERKWKELSGVATVEPQPALNPNHIPSGQAPSSPPVPQQATSPHPVPQQAAPSHPVPQQAAPSHPVPQQATSPQPVPQQAEALPRQSSHTRLFALGYNDLVLKTYDEFSNWKRYLAENPYRLALKRALPHFLRVKENVDIHGYKCSAVGNLSLLSSSRKLRVRISRSISPELLEQEKARLLTAAREGAILVSAAISPGEKSIMRTAFDEGLPLIILLENGLHPMSKPRGERFRACAEGRLLLLSPFPHHNERIPITRSVCDTLNALAWDIAEGQ